MSGDGEQGVQEALDRRRPRRVHQIDACDLRYCTVSASFSVKGMDLAITANLGTFHSLPAIVGYGNAMDLDLTVQRFFGLEAKELGMVSKVFSSPKALEKGVSEIAEAVIRAELTLLKFEFNLSCYRGELAQLHYQLKTEFD